MWLVGRVLQCEVLGLFFNHPTQPPIHQPYSTLHPPTLPPYKDLEMQSEQEMEGMKEQLSMLEDAVASEKRKRQEVETEVAHKNHVSGCGHERSSGWGGWVDIGVE